MSDPGRNLLDLLKQDPGKKILHLLTQSPSSSAANDIGYRRTTNSPAEMHAVAPNSLVPNGVFVNFVLPGADIRYMSGLYDTVESWAFFDKLAMSRDVHKWTRMGFGREIVQWSQPAGITYSFSDDTYIGQDFPAFALAIKSHVESILAPIYGEEQTRFNYCVCNYYATGRSGVFWHTDAEPELRDDCPIACVSFGAERVFSLIPNIPNTKQPPLDIRLQHGSLVIMAGATQRNYLHAIQKEEGVGNRPRFSLTFRVHHVT